MSTITIGVVADMRRQREAWELSNAVDAKVLSFDDGTMGCTRNHIKVWTKVLQHGGDWAVVLEDDALPVDPWRETLEGVLANPPTDIVGLYLGRGYPRSWQRFIRRAMTSDAHYVKSSHLLHGVGTAVRMALVPDMLRFIGNMSPQDKLWPIDEQITAWARLRGYPVAYAKPSIIQHSDGPTLLDHPDGAGRHLARRAWAFGSRETWNGASVVTMP